MKAGKREKQILGLFQKAPRSSPGLLPTRVRRAARKVVHCSCVEQGADAPGDCQHHLAVLDRQHSGHLPQLSGPPQVSGSRGCNARSAPASLATASSRQAHCFRLAASISSTAPLLQASPKKMMDTFGCFSCGLPEVIKIFDNWLEAMRLSSVQRSRSGALRLWRQGRQWPLQIWCGK